MGLRLWAFSEAENWMCLEERAGKAAWTEEGPTRDARVLHGGWTELVVGFGLSSLDGVMWKLL